MYYPYAACNLWRAVFPSSKVEFPEIAQNYFFSAKVIWLLCFSCPLIAIAALLLKEWKYSAGSILFAYSFFLCFVCCVLIFDPSKAWNKKQTKIAHRCRMQTWERSAFEVSFVSCEWKSGTCSASMQPFQPGVTELWAAVALETPYMAPGGDLAAMWGLCCGAYLTAHGHLFPSLHWEFQISIAESVNTAVFVPLRLPGL